MEKRIKVREGDVVTYSYEGVSTRALPVNAKITNIRLDLNWREVLLAEHESSNNISSPLSLNGIPSFLFFCLLMLCCRSVEGCNGGCESGGGKQGVWVLE